MIRSLNCLLCIFAAAAFSACSSGPAEESASDAQTHADSASSDLTHPGAGDTPILARGTLANRPSSWRVSQAALGLVQAALDTARVRT